VQYDLFSGVSKFLKFSEFFLKFFSTLNILFRDTLLSVVIDWLSRV